MFFDRRTVQYTVALTALLGLTSACGLRRHKYDNPIGKNTQQPDKILFDKAINDVEHSRYEIARLTLQTLINTYDASEYLAKAKLAIADSWYREGGAHGLAQAEAEYKDFILFYPTMEEAAESQEKICNIHYKQMEKSDRDPMHALRAEDECRQVLIQFPNSKFAPKAQQLLRNVQEVLADHEYKTAVFYHTKGSYPAAANRFEGLVAQYPLYSQADDALWLLADSYTKMGDRFENRAAAAYQRLVKEYPLSDHVDAAKQQLIAMKQPVPEADPVAYARMKYELENRENPGLMHHVWGLFRSSPDVSMAAKSGIPTMTTMRPGIPLSVPVTATAASTEPGAGASGSVNADVSVSTVSDSKALDTQPDARQNPPSAGQQAQPPAQPAAAGPPAAPDTQAAAPQQLPTNHPMQQKKQKKSKKSKKPEAQAQPQPSK